MTTKKFRGRSKYFESGVYSSTHREFLVAEDALSTEEDGFMQGYEEALK